jgi:hypothetical protein
MLEREQFSLAVGHADAADMSFYSSAMYFHTGKFCRDEWSQHVKTVAQVTTPLTLLERAFVIVEGDILANVTLSGGTLLVHGNVCASIETTGQCEIALAGDIVEAASISGDGIFRVFVGGDVFGAVRSRGSCKLWVEGNLRGQVWTGHPSTQLRVRGDSSATIRPSGKPALLYVMVDGFMAYASLEATAAVGYTEFNASVGKSDRPAGFYPEEVVHKAFRQHSSHNRWVIRQIDSQPGSSQYSRRRST